MKTTESSLNLSGRLVEQCFVPFSDRFFEVHGRDRSSDESYAGVSYSRIPFTILVDGP